MSSLYLIPTPLGKQKENLSLPEYTLGVVRKLNIFIVENVRTTQSFLQWIGHPLKPYEPEFRILNKKTPDQEIYGFLNLLKNGDVGLMSEAGAPAVADPGSLLVRFAHDAGHKVVPLAGPSSILLALMGSGMNGQTFAFHGYLPVDDRERADTIRNLESESRNRKCTQIFMETPFRNQVMLEALINTCRPETRLCVASNLTMPDEWIKSRPIHKWKNDPVPDLTGKPALFLILA